MAVVFQKPHALTDAITHYCPGCTHGIVHRLVAEVIDELGVEGKTVGDVPVGCSVLAYNYFNCDMIEAPHGRAPAVATGVRRALPENVVFTIRATATLQQSVPQKPFMQLLEVKTSPSFLSTMQSMV